VLFTPKGLLEYNPHLAIPGHKWSFEQSALAKKMSAIWMLHNSAPSRVCTGADQSQHAFVKGRHTSRIVIGQMALYCRSTDLVPTNSMISSANRLAADQV